MNVKVIFSYTERWRAIRAAGEPISQTSNGAVGIALLVRCLLCRHEELSSDPDIYIKKKMYGIL